MLSAIFDNGLFDGYHTITSHDVQLWINQVMRSSGDDKLTLGEFVRLEIVNAKKAGKPLAYRILPEHFSTGDYDPDMYYLSDITPRALVEYSNFIAIDFGYKYKPLKSMQKIEDGWYVPRY